MALDFAIILGSVRGERQGTKVARFISTKLVERNHRVTLIDPKEQQLPFLDRMYKEYAPGTAPTAMERVAGILGKADGFVIVSAEYNHGEPPALKNLLDHFQSEHHYKPSGIVTYSAGPFGGERALITLRAILAELGTPSIPSAFPVSRVGEAFDEAGRAKEGAYDRRVSGFLDEFEWYAQALKVARGRARVSAQVPTQQALCQGK